MRGGGAAAGRPAGEISLPVPLDGGPILNRPADRAPDAAVGREILVDNPARPHGFA